MTHIDQTGDEVHLKDFLHSNFRIRDLNVNSYMEDSREGKKGMVINDVRLHKDTLIKNKHQTEKLYQDDADGVGFHDDTFYLDDEEKQDRDSENFPMKFSNGLQNIEKNASKKLPQALIIGVKKGGTKALLEFLRIHPDIRAPGTEIHFFDKFYSKGFKWYR